MVDICSRVKIYKEKAKGRGQERCDPAPPSGARERAPKEAGGEAVGYQPYGFASCSSTETAKTALAHYQLIDWYEV